MAVPIPTVPQSSGAVVSHSDPRSTEAVEELTVYAVVVASACIVVGLVWDISWHRTIGRDTFWSPPHLLSQAGAIISGLACGYLVLRTSFAGTPDDKSRTVTDQEERIEYIKDIQRTMAESMLIVPYTGSAGYGYVQPWVENYYDKGGYGYIIESIAKSWFTKERLAQG